MKTNRVIINEVIINLALAPILATVADMNEQAWEEQIKILWPKAPFTDPSFASSEPHKYMEGKGALQKQ